jgi:ubiquitin carboxyl-terminal hydrolase 7
VEEFYDVQLKVKGIPDLLASFKDHCAVEMLDGDNK